MSARDANVFITSYRAEDVEKLTLRMKNGVGSVKYKPAEYKRLQAIVDAKRLESDLIGQKVQKTRCAAKATRESSTLRQQRQVWSRECPRLQKAEEKAENDLHHFLRQIGLNSTENAAVLSLQGYVLGLEEEREEFRVATVEPVHQLKDDLCFRLSEAQHQQLSSHRSDWEQVIQQINFVKDQQEGINAKLHAESQVLEEEISGLGLEEYFPSTSDNLVDVENVPEEVLDADCPYPDLKDSLIQAFHSLSESYTTVLHSLQDQVQRADRFRGWSADDHQRFLFTLSQYTRDVPGHRALSMDMLLRLFPEKTRQELMDLQRLLDWQRFTQAQLRALAQQRQRDREELLARALVTLQEARHAHQEELEHHRDCQHQQDICSHLREKLRRWRAQQEEAAKLEAAIAARQREREEARLKREREKETAVRAEQREKVKQFHSLQTQRMEMQEEEDRERLANLRSVMEEQARRDKERVQFRADVLQQRREEREALEQERQREEEERRRRLEVLRNQIGVVAEADPRRMMADTECWRSRQASAEGSELQRPLYSINTYTDTQIVSDPRVRAERALREAGLQHSQYARDVLSVIKPPKPQRRDTATTLKF